MKFNLTVGPWNLKPAPWPILANFIRLSPPPPLPIMIQIVCNTGEPRHTDPQPPPAADTTPELGAPEAMPEGLTKIDRLSKRVKEQQQRIARLFSPQSKHYYHSA